MAVTEARAPRKADIRRPPRTDQPVKARLRRAATPWLFLAPALLLFLYFKFIPMAQAVQMSFQEVRPFLGNTYVGGENYSEIAGSADFGAAVWHTVFLAVATTAGSIVIGLALALLLEGQTRSLWFIRSAIFLPVVTAMAVVAEVWRVMYYPAEGGALNSVLGVLGLGPSEFLNSPDSSLASIAFVGIWRGAPYDMMIFLAGLAGVDRMLYEASAVDGASRFRRIWHVTLPGLRPVFAILLTLAAIRGLRIFTEVFLLTNGGPDGSTEVLLTLTYKLGLERNELGVAAAGTVLLFLILLVLTIASRLRRRDVRAR
ncbi:MULTISPECIES: carbohydrate ABC transporter permease [unclassified Streptomyces]|uniref:carbohydrate ABC transporter permease n=1 Tax=unclassified Streptomyces TaxID=2593676 RepID=UPI000AE2FBAE|nr:MULTISPECIES: sugar ABC transporter permease [unclassified Streptomyces]AZM60032.1 sugar ABC transporter permease [Streptomyces sp. WAC 01438]RSM99791.1 sugar ABC transporter permease [Streptomyces sp. WAC 01420]